MRVEQKNQMLEALQQNGSKSETKSAADMIQSKTGAVTSINKKNTSIQMQDTTYLNPAKEEKKSIAEKIEENSELDAFDRKNQMAVLSNTASEEDYAKMQEEGFSLDSMEAHKIITVTDKIKMQLAKAGKEVFGDGLDAATLEVMTGNSVLAMQLERAFQKMDLPVTEDNMKSGLEALEQSQVLQQMTDGAIKYMIDNKMAPTIENIYMAQFSGSAYYAGRQEQNEDIEELSGQIEQMISSMGFSVNDETMDDSKWLIENQIPLTEDNLKYYEDLKEVQLPVQPERAARQIAVAVAEGSEPQDAMLIDGYSLWDKAEHAAEVIEQATEEDVTYVVNHNMELTVNNLDRAVYYRGQNDTSTEQEGEVYTDKGLELLTAKRQLEEIRLVMSVEANYSLLKQGLSIDTEPLVKIVDELKNMENQYYEKLLESHGVSAAPEDVQLLAETTEKIQKLGQMPAYVLGVPEADSATMQQTYDLGMQMQENLEKAGQRYETLMTAPRMDLGDSIQKAFRNVDNILSDLNLDITAENERAVRILGYNSLDITTESVMQMKAADEEVQRMFKNMTPAVVTQMIKQGINPFEMKISDLNKIAEQLKTEVGKDDNARFSEYLYKLEKSHQITDEERQSFIGVYRLIHQVEQTDGAAIGALVNQGAEPTLKNLLTAVRTSRKTNRMDISVDDNYGEAKAAEENANSISQQIEAAYQTNCMKDAADILSPGRMKQVMEQNENWQNMTPEELAKALEQSTDTDAEAGSEILQQQMEVVKNAAETSEEVYRMLEQFDLPNTPLNIVALNSMLSNRNQLFRQLFGEESTNPDRDKDITIEDIEAIKEDIIEDFGEAVSEPEALAEVQETLGKVAENVMKTMIADDDVTSIDVREMRLMQAKLSITQSMAKKEHYSVPVLIGDKVTNVSLKIVRDADTKGFVDIMLENEMTGKIAATFQAKEKGISGLIVTDRQETRELLSDQVGFLASTIMENEGDQVDLMVAVEKKLDLNHFSGASKAKSDSENNEENGNHNEKENSGYKVQTKRLYHIAESFLKVMNEFA